MKNNTLLEAIESRVQAKKRLLKTEERARIQRNQYFVESIGMDMESQAYHDLDDLEDECHEIIQLCKERLSELDAELFTLESFRLEVKSLGGIK